MDWIIGLQNAIDYIEDNLTGTIDYETVAAQSFSSSYHFQRVFSILCGFTIGEYIRNRRLSLAGSELATTDAKVIDIALKYGYESPDRIEKKPEMILTGYKAHFTGAPYGKDRERQEEQLFVTTRGKQWFLRGASRNIDAHCVITNITDEGYDYYYCHLLDGWERDNLYNKDVTGVDFVEDLGLENIIIPETTYVVFETKNVKSSICDYFDLLNLRIQILTEWMPEMGFQLKNAPELAVYHWLPKAERNVQIWMPIEKIK